MIQILKITGTGLGKTGLIIGAGIGTGVVFGFSLTETAGLFALFNNLVDCGFFFSYVSQVVSLFNLHVEYFFSSECFLISAALVQRELLSVVPVICYPNAEIQKKQIMQDNKGKAGIYRWVNLVNGKSYVGSAVYLTKRLKQYYSPGFLKKELNNGSSIIYRAMLKYGYSNFSLEILEYCDIKGAIEREQYYIDNLNPQYNIAPKAGSWLGCFHNEETKARLSKAAIGNTNSIRHKIQVLDLETGTKNTYVSISEAARALGICQSTISMYFTRNDPKPCKGRYIFNKI